MCLRRALRNKIIAGADFPNLCQVAVGHLDSCTDRRGVQSAADEFQGEIVIVVRKFIAVKDNASHILVIGDYDIDITITVGIETRSPPALAGVN